MPRPAAGAKRKDNLRFSFLFELLPFPWIVWRRLPICDCCEIGERQSGYCSVTFSAFSQFTDSVLLHRWVHLSRRDITVSRNSLTRYTAWHLRIRRLVQFIFVALSIIMRSRLARHGYVAPCGDETICVAYGSRPCEYVSTGEHTVLPCGRKNPLPYSFFAAVTCRQAAPDPPKRKWELRG